MGVGVILMNQRGIALAADSAATLGNREVIFNTHQKIIPIGRFPVAFLKAKPSLFMDVLCETLINKYSSFMYSIPHEKEHVLGYFIDFMNYLENNLSYYSGEVEKRALSKFIYSYLDYIYSEYENQINEDKDENIALSNLAKRLKKFFESLAKEKSELRFKNQIIWGSVKQKYPQIIENTFNQYLKNERNLNHEGYDFDQKQTKILDILDMILFKYGDIFFTDLNKYIKFSEFILAGYGSKSPYPELVHVKLFLAFDGKTLYVIESEFFIPTNDRKYVQVMDEVSAIQAFYKGIEVSFENKIKDSISNRINHFLFKHFEKDKLLQSKNLVQILINDLNSTIAKDFEFLKYQNSEPLFSSIQYAPLTNLMEMAEELVSIAALRSKYLADETSNGRVGKPIDVAFISKLNGFQWNKN
jgi:hypothetical protein